MSRLFAIIVSALVLLWLCTRAGAINDFTGDANCVALWRVENGALTTDTIGTNTLTNTGTVDSETEAVREGGGSGYFFGLSDRLHCDDTNLDAGFPLKNGDSNKKISVCFWFNVSTGFPASGVRDLLGKYEQGAGKSSFVLYFEKGANWTLKLGIGYNSGNSTEVIDHGSTVAANAWYHIGVTFQDSDKSYKIRIWDAQAGALLGGAEVSGTATNNIYVSTMEWTIGTTTGGSDRAAGGYRDEVVVFNDILSSAEIDEIRAGTFGTGGGGAGGASLFGGVVR